MPTSHLARRSFLAAMPTPLMAANDRISTAFIGVGVMGSENLKAAMAQPGVTKFL